MSYFPLFVCHFSFVNHNCISVVVFFKSTIKIAVFISKLCALAKSPLTAVDNKLASFRVTDDKNCSIFFLQELKTVTADANFEFVIQAIGLLLVLAAFKPHCFEMEESGLHVSAAFLFSCFFGAFSIFLFSTVFLSVFLLLIFSNSLLL